MRCLAVSLAVAAACSGGDHFAADATFIDSPIGSADARADAPTDAPAGPSVQCGSMTCGGTTECCVMGASQSCVPTGSCGGAVLACDGREDCGANQDCCVVFALPLGPFGDGGLPGFDGGLPGFDGGLPGFDGGLPGLDGGTGGGGGAMCGPAGSCQLRSCNDVTDCNSGERCCAFLGQAQTCSSFCP